MSVLRKGGPSSHSRTQHHDYVFTTETGRLMDQRNASRGYARALKRAGLETVPARFHIIRHSVTSKMLVDGAVSMRTASEVLGRATTSITADIYGHVAQQAKSDALGEVAGALHDPTSAKTPLRRLQTATRDA